MATSLDLEAPGLNLGTSTLRQEAASLIGKGIEQDDGLAQLDGARGDEKEVRSRKEASDFDFQPEIPDPQAVVTDAAAGHGGLQSLKRRFDEIIDLDADEQDTDERPTPADAQKVDWKDVYQNAAEFIPASPRSRDKALPAWLRRAEATQLEPEVQSSAERVLGQLDVAELATQLSVELAILRAVLYKNRNQHRRVIAFRHLLEVERMLRRVHCSRLTDVVTEFKTLFVARNGLYEVAPGEAGVLLMQRQLAVCRVSQGLIPTIRKAALHVTPHLARMHFVKLYLIVFSILGRLQVLVCGLMLAAVANYNSLVDLTCKLPFKSYEGRLSGSNLPQMLKCSWNETVPVLEAIPFDVGNSLPEQAAAFAMQNPTLGNAEQVSVPISAEEAAQLRAKIAAGEAIQIANGPTNSSKPFGVTEETEPPSGATTQAMGIKFSGQKNKAKRAGQKLNKDAGENDSQWGNDETGTQFLLQQFIQMHAQNNAQKAQEVLDSSTDEPAANQGAPETAGKTTANNSEQHKGDSAKRKLPPLPMGALSPRQRKRAKYKEKKKDRKRNATDVTAGEDYGNHVSAAAGLGNAGVNTRSSFPPAEAPAPALPARRGLFSTAYATGTPVSVSTQQPATVPLLPAGRINPQPVSQHLSTGLEPGPKPDYDKPGQAVEGMHGRKVPHFESDGQSSSLAVTEGSNGANLSQGKQAKTHENQTMKGRVPAKAGAGNGNRDAFLGAPSLRGASAQDLAHALGEGPAEDLRQTWKREEEAVGPGLRRDSDAWQGFPGAFSQSFGVGQFADDHQGEHDNDATAAPGEGGWLGDPYGADESFSPPQKYDPGPEVLPVQSMSSGDSHKPKLIQAPSEGKGTPLVLGLGSAKKRKRGKRKLAVDIEPSEEKDPPSWNDLLHI